MGGREGEDGLDSERNSKEVVNVGVWSCSIRCGNSLRERSKGRLSFWEGGYNTIFFESLALPLGRPLLKWLEGGFMAQPG
jgi:hypothetical protein